VKRTKKQRLEHAGWVVGDSAPFLQLSVEENRFGTPLLSRTSAAPSDTCKLFYIIRICLSSR